MLIITIIRHAKTNQESPTGQDFDRQLLPRGKAQCKDLHFYLDSLQLRDQLLLVSTAKRTQQTYQLIKDSFESNKVISSNELYLASHKELLHFLWEQKENANIILIGHNYGISELASYISGEDIDLATSELVQIELPIDSWNELSNGHGTIVRRYRSQS